MSNENQQPGGNSLRPGSAPWVALLALGFVAVSAVLQLPTSRGPFVSDDIYYIANNPYVLFPSVPHMLVILDPTSDLTLQVANYAPTHLITHVVQHQLFGADPLGYHLTNALAHGLASALLVPVLMASGIGALPAALGGAFFLVHTANLEALAWISQIKTLEAMVFMLAALLLAGRRPVLSSVAFTLSITSKAMAVVALPVAALFEWVRRDPARESSGERRGLGYLAAWTVIFGLFMITQFAAFQHANASVPPVSEDVAVRVWSSAAIGARYLVMAATTLGVAAWHEPAPVTSPFDPWVLGALAAAVLLTWRTVWALRRRREEAVWWIWAAGSYLPVSQIFPFLFPMADRYLYFILPGLIGGVLLAGRDALQRLAPARRAQVGTVLAAAAVAVCIVFAWRTHDRARIWTSEERLMADTLYRYPDGSAAAYFRTRRAIERGDLDEAMVLLRKATDDPRRGLEALLVDPWLRPLHGHPDFRALLVELSEERVERLMQAEYQTDANLLHLGRAYMLLGRPEEAIAALEQILEREGSGFRADAQRQIQAARAAMEQRDAEQDAAGP
jgi:hypothetical protein